MELFIQVVTCQRVETEVKIDSQAPARFAYSYSFFGIFSPGKIYFGRFTLTQIKCLELRGTRIVKPRVYFGPHENEKDQN